MLYEAISASLTANFPPRPTLQEHRMRYFIAPLGAAQTELQICEKSQELLEFSRFTIVTKH